MPGSVEESYFGIDEGAGQNSSDREITYILSCAAVSDSACLTTAYDYCHLNSLEKDDDGSYLVSMRGPSTLYKINGDTGEIMWRLGGMNSNFTISDEDRFYYQHDARCKPFLGAHCVLSNL